jgi:hypothetical protein
VTAKARFYLIRIPPADPPQPVLVGPYMNPSHQMMAAVSVRDTTDETILWLDVNNGVPEVGAFDPLWWEQRKEPRRN